MHVFSLSICIMYNVPVLVHELAPRQIVVQEITLAMYQLVESIQKGLLFILGLVKYIVFVDGNENVETWMLSLAFNFF